MPTGPLQPGSLGALLCQVLSACFCRCQPLAWAPALKPPDFPHFRGPGRPDSLALRRDLSSDLLPGHSKPQVLVRRSLYLVGKAPLSPAGVACGKRALRCSGSGITEGAQVASLSHGALTVMAAGSEPSLPDGHPTEPRGPVCSPSPGTACTERENWC